jgi:hypothetical protein
MSEAEKEALELKSELAGLFRYLERVREENAAISRPADGEKTEDEKLLAGPQLEGKGLDQPAIDALFD